VKEKNTYRPRPTWKRRPANINTTLHHPAARHANHPRQRRRGGCCVEALEATQVRHGRSSSSFIESAAYLLHN
jgi:hypothetical protein